MNKIIEEDIRNILSDETIPWGRFRDKSVLITGASGMLPSYMVYVLLFLNQYYKFNTRIYALVRNKRRAMELFDKWLNDLNFTLLVQDVCAPISISDDINFIIHAASQASPKYYSVDPVGTINANVLGTINTLELARKQKHVEGYFFYSSSEVYGIVNQDNFPLTENEYGYINLLSVRSCYCESKRMGEQLCVAYNHQYGIPTKIARIFHTFGPGMQLNDGRVFADFVKNIINNEDITLKSDGSAQRSFCYLTDAVRAYMKILLDGDNAKAYNVANNGNEISMLQLANMLVSLYPDKRLQVRVLIDSKDVTSSSMKSPLQRLIPDCSSIEQLNWKPYVSIEDGFRRTIESFSV